MTTGPEICAGGNAGDFTCSGIDLRSRVPLSTMQGSAGNDIWGWFDAQTGSEYALMGMTNGTAFVNVTDPENPVFLGNLPTATISTPWRDIKVYQDHAYVVADDAGAQSARPGYCRAHFAQTQGPGSPDRLRPVDHSAPYLRSAECDVSEIPRHQRTAASLVSRRKERVNKTCPTTVD